MSTGRRVTRLQLSHIKDTFPFMDLPAELRNDIYIHSIDFTTLERYFDAAYQTLITNKKIKNRQHHAPQRKTPTIFLINRQIFRESSYLLQKSFCVRFSHGLLKTGSIENVISVNLLRQVSSIEITDSGHPIIKGSILPQSWHGYMTLLSELGKILAEGHKLKELVIDFKDDRLKEHMTHCYEADYQCGFRDQMQKALESLRNVRGIGKVTLNGLNAQEAKELKSLMEKKPVNFMSLPLELRDMIYEHTMDISEISKPLTRGLIDYPHKTKDFPFPPLTTPNVLLLNKQISEEAIKVLRKKPVHITFTSKHNISDQAKLPSILAFVSRGSLKQVKTITITMESWEWVYNLENRLINILAASKHLQNFHFNFHDSLKSSFTKLSTQRYPDKQIHDSLKKLTKIRGLTQVTFSGDLPIVYTDALAQIMTSKPSIPDAKLPKLKAVTGEDKVVDITEEKEEEETSTTETQQEQP
ncbi:uncharacterized protein MYCFIDRAFT_214119 [Pseudocercospora fijiensis CIRAD86]|uniref:F-box domain-containing protein n=1 Tax=Pseudocercospora fijiensis (strain CIRAD86) TaxID=383855 RepID=M3BA36_PSEFD|nr:uncharacterized protein MYCFIDRAFT_214119 [Pseudocercospora fijiensis CIRAD86]EME86118.1 hypothetical protein MYCFIDRAFT_214119 [Pseudocercospora fijiensis CIRAD86]